LRALALARKGAWVRRAERRFGRSQRAPRRTAQGRYRSSPTRWRTIS